MGGGAALDVISCEELMVENAHNIVTNTITIQIVTVYFTHLYKKYLRPVFYVGSRHKYTIF